MDSSGTYMIIENVVTPVSDDSNETLSLCSQTTADHLHYLKDLTETWHGPVSVTVFTHGHEAAFALYSIAYMHTCFEKVQTSVRFHVAYPISHPPINLKTVINMEMHCDNFESLINENNINYENEIPYPHNVLRNIAVSSASTPYILVIDIDMIPSQDLNETFSQFISRQSISEIKGDKNKVEQTVYVVPAFESQGDHKTFDKQSLLKEWDFQNVRPFYKNVCWKCQKVTDYDKWRGLPNLPFLDVGYILEWEDPWEPFYIARRKDLPPYDGRFKQYGFNRISQVCELHIAGYQFAVLNNAFLVHRGFKEPASFHAKKDAENSRNRELFRTFKENLKERYPKSARQC
ncbi:beta-1,4-glucuronyltransferase 1-like [Mercenaria mercenaria]|uniref:beta-1,4-glucuronyltransferase 1-like n=1 Tax=Mercenaria mercenaria TaxID=6596 RepID=UPI00234F3A6A|nr:beta-1,4-glucuronyltransferase 1-like [Mercenaria mercenaria]